MSAARSRGFAVADERLSAIAEHTEADLASASAAYREGKGQGGGVTRAGYALWALQLGGHAPDETTEAVTEFLLKREAGQGHWKASSNRPPSEASAFTSTYLAVRGLNTFATDAQRDRARARIEAARTWLESATPRDTEDRVFRLLGLKEAEGSAEAIATAAADLIADQRADGGWGQTPARPSDSYATGSALYALLATGEARGDEPAIRAGLAFLLKTQRDDGSWHVASRSKPFQTYFESGFPHGPDQFISVAASSWATAALCLALPPIADRSNAPAP